MVDCDKYILVLKAFDDGLLCMDCEDKINYGTYYDGLVGLCDECKIYKTIDCDTLNINE